MLYSAILNDGIEGVLLCTMRKMNFCLRISVFCSLLGVFRDASIVYVTGSVSAVKQAHADNANDNAFPLNSSDFINGNGTRACESPIYCKGLMLDMVQKSRLFPDSKTFVDMTLHDSPAETERKFKELYDVHGGHLDTAEIYKFVNKHMSGPGNEFEEWLPPDWTERPKLLERISDPAARKWAANLNELWRILGRKIKIDVDENQERHSLYYLPKPFIVPGDRFREIYYWDSYWILKGLLLSDMVSTARGMIENFIYLVKKLGYVPNGGRVYLAGRSQPPLLIPMVALYYKATGDKEFLQSVLPTLEKEYSFWHKERSVSVRGPNGEHRLSQYNVKLDFPRPEGYAEDLALAKGLSRKNASRLFSNVASTCESGWDFSSRWFAGASLKTVKTRFIVPVDLNSILCWNEKLLAEFYSDLSDHSKQAIFLQRAENRRLGMRDVMWDSAKGAWFDYHLDTRRRTEDFYPSNIYPLFSGCYGADDMDRLHMVNKVLNYIKNTDVLVYPGGIPTSLRQSGEQWDMPNAWPPAVHLFIESLANTRNKRAVQIASNLSIKWLRSNYASWKKSHHMYEKYNALEAGTAGGGGEYGVQIGFGWTNGVILQLISNHADLVNLLNEDSFSAQTLILISIAVFLIVVVIVVVVRMRPGMRKQLRRYISFS